MYWRVMFKEAAIVNEKHGARDAYASMALITSLVPGIFMAVMFGQMNLAGMPVKAVFGEQAGTTAEDMAEMRGMPLEEQLVLKTGSEEPRWSEIDPRIEDVVQVVPGLYTLIVPTFKPMGEILIKLAQEEELQLLQISNQSQVQVRVELREPDQLEALKEEVGCEVLFDYKFPLDKFGNRDTATSAALCVDIPYLLQVIRMCHKLRVEVKQIYDWYC
jgi:hypothetical protein